MTERNRVRTTIHVSSMHVCPVFDAPVTITIWNRGVAQTIRCVCDWMAWAPAFEEQAS